MTKCTARRKDGNPCRAWAMAHTDPPRCRAHAANESQAAPPGDADALSDVRRDPPEILETIEGIIADLAAKQSRLSELIDDEMVAEQMGLDAIRWLFVLHGQNASRLGRLLRDRRALSGAAADGIMGSVADALDEMSKDFGVKL